MDSGPSPMKAIQHRIDQVKTGFAEFRKEMADKADEQKEALLNSLSNAYDKSKSAIKEAVHYDEIKLAVGSFAENTINSAKDTARATSNWIGTKFSDAKTATMSVITEAIGGTGEVGRQQLEMQKEQARLLAELAEQGKKPDPNERTADATERMAATNEEIAKSMDIIIKSGDKKMTGGLKKYDTPMQPAYEDYGAKLAGR